MTERTFNDLIRGLPARESTPPPTQPPGDGDGGKGEGERITFDTNLDGQHYRTFDLADLD